MTTMDINFTLMTSTGEFNRGLASDLLIRQMTDLQMEKEKRLNHNRFDMERYSYRSAGVTKSKKRICNIFRKQAQGDSGKIHPVLRATGIKD